MVSNGKWNPCHCNDCQCMSVYFWKEDIERDFYTQEQFHVVLTDVIFDITPVIIYKGKEYSSSFIGRTR